ncbi:GxxExxY protein [Gracilimonas sp. BCB1]|uniref:GxxExxY protein n=1 Tax=Gracilimonas sp. BCB1 TaxID=3152362 RepID=UPI0032D8DF39
MTNKIYKYTELTRTIIGCAMEVHNTLGNGFQEKIYQRALAIELGKCGLEYESEFSMPIMYKGVQLGMRRVDLLVEQKISVELKAVLQLEKAHIAQALNYLEAYQLEVGLLINFGNNRLKFHRLEHYL